MHPWGRKESTLLPTGKREARPSEVVLEPSSPAAPAPGDPVISPPFLLRASAAEPWQVARVLSGGSGRDWAGGSRG